MEENTINQSVVSPSVEMFETQQQSEQEVSPAYVDYGDLDASQRAELDNLILQESQEQSEESDYELPVNAEKGFYLNEQINVAQNNDLDFAKNIIVNFISTLTNQPKEIVEFVDINNKQEVLGFIENILKYKFYPTDEVEHLAKYIQAGGTMQDFIEALQPIDFATLSDEEVLYAYYKDKMEDGVLADFINTLSETGKLKKKADEIRKEVGVVEYSSEELVELQKRSLEAQKQKQEYLKQIIQDAVKNLGLRFKNQNEYFDFVSSLTEVKSFPLDNGEYITNTEFLALINTDPYALVLSAYYLFNHDEMQKKIKSNNEMLENIKKNLTQIKPTNFTPARKGVFGQ